MSTPYEVFVIGFDQYGGMTLASVGDLYDQLDEGEQLDEALTNAGIDTIFELTQERVRKIVELNRTGDANAYWDIKTKRRRK